MTRRARRLGRLAALGIAAVACGDPAAREALGPPAAVDVQGHRGARGLLPENTLPAFERAIALGVTTLELDLGLTRDGAVVVAHDPFVSPALCLRPDGRRLAGERGPWLRDLTLAQLRAYDCGSLNPAPARFPEPPRENVPGATVPTLSEVFDLVRERGADVCFNAEVKARPGGEGTAPLAEFVAAVVDEVRRAGMVGRTTLQAFDWRALALAREREPGLRTSGLVAPDTLSAEWLGGLDPARFRGFLDLLRAAPYVDDLSPWWRHLEPGRHFLGPVAAFREAGYRVVPWTVDDRAVMERMLELGVDGIISDRPDLLIDVVRESGREVLRPGRASGTGAADADDGEEPWRSSGSITCT